jgi:glycosyltransferase involved in cell wall biosynthesis
MEQGMIIGYDGKRAVCNMTGLGNYSRYVIDMLSVAYPNNQYRLYSPRLRDNDRLSPLLARGNVSVVTPNNAIGRTFGAFWRTLDMPLQLREDGVAVYHGLSNELPLTIGRTEIPTVLTVHDLIYRRVPEDYNAIDRRLYDFKYGKSAKIATRIIAISECTKRDIVNDFQVDPAKIDVIYQGCDPIFSMKVELAQRQAVRERYKLPQSYFISVGTVRRRKNQLLAVRALARLPREVSMVIVSDMSGEYAEEVKREIARLRLDDRVLWLQGVPFSDLPALYHEAIFSSYTSRYEGFGIPIIESLTVGTPVIATTGSCLEEAGGEGALYVNPDDLDGYVANAQRLIDDGYLRRKLTELGARHIKKFNMAEFARLTMAAYNKAIINKML